MARRRQRVNTAEPRPTEEIAGVIVGCTYHNSQNGFSIIRCMNDKEEIFTAAGSLSGIRNQDRYIFTGWWDEHPIYGRQFVFQKAEIQLPTTQDGVLLWLASVSFGIGPAKAKIIYEALGPQCLDIIRDRGAEYVIEATDGKITIAQATKIYDALSHDAKQAELTALIAGEGLSANTASRIYHALGPGCIEEIKQNPYILAERVDGIGFVKADQIARRLGIPSDSPFRYKAAVRYALNESAQEGHVYLAPRDLIESLKRPSILGKASTITMDDVKRACEELEEDTGVIIERDEGKIRIYLPKLHQAEVRAALHLRRLNFSAPDKNLVRESDFQDYLTALETELGIAYNDYQKMALRMALESPICVITGGPGTGKTTITQGLLLIDKWRKRHRNPRLCSPTGRAAKRMSEVTKQEAKTIHRLLQFMPNGGKGEFLYNEDNQLFPERYIIDEASMIDIELAHSLFQAIPSHEDTQVVIIGDIDQLPSVGPGSVLRDIIESNVIPTVRLRYNYRQEQGSKIAAIAAQIVEGQVPDLNPALDFTPVIVNDPAEVVEYIKSLEPQLKELKSVMDFQCLIPMYPGAAGVDSINRLIQDMLNPSVVADKEKIISGKPYRPGDKVIVLKNDYRKNVFNGDQGIVVDILNNGIQANIEGEEVVFGWEESDKFSLAYATSVHKCVSLDTLIETDKGLIRIEDADQGCVASVDGPKAYTRTANLSAQKMLRITTKDGYRVTVTPDHGIDIWDGHQYRRAEAQNLKAGSFMRVALGVRVEPSNAPPMPEPIRGDLRERVFYTPKTLTKEVAEFIGLMVADGTNYGRGFRLAKRHKEVADRFSLLCMMLFGAEAKQSSKRNAHFSEVSSVFLSRWITSIGGMEPNRKAVPACILAGNSDHHRAFLRGLFEDSGVNVRINTIDHIDFTTCEERLATDVQVMLARLGIVSNHVREVGKYKYSKLYIYGEYARMFGEVVGFISNVKRRRCSLAAGKQKNYLIPVAHNEVGELYRSHAHIFTGHDKGNARNRGYISRSKAKEILETDNAPLWLQDRFKSHHDRIVSIEQVKDKSTCLHVPDGHRFLQNSISGWNSQGSEYPLVIMVLTKSHYIMLKRNLFYTGVTRARDGLILIYDPKAVEVAVSKEDTERRNSRLKERLIGDGFYVS